MSVLVYSIDSGLAVIKVYNLNKMDVTCINIS